MNLAFTKEHEEFRSSLRRFLARRSPSGEVRRLMATSLGYDPAMWQRMATELGLQGLIVPEKYGGSGFGPVELLIVLEEMGRVLLCAPYFATAVLAIDAIIASGDAAGSDSLLPGIAKGETIATLAIAEHGIDWDPSAISCRAQRRDSGWSLEGQKHLVIDGHVAHVIIVAACTDSGLSLFVVRGDAHGLIRQMTPSLDQTRKLAKLTFNHTRATLLGTDGGAGGIVSRVLDYAAVGLAAEQVGGAERCLEMAVDYATHREQFDRPIGSFQAIKHMCADMLLEVESARSAAYYAAWAAADGSEELPLVASLAKAYCSDAYVHVAGQTIQILGGIGFTWEHDAHLYLKRAKSSQLLFGTPSAHRELLVERLGI